MWELPEVASRVSTSFDMLGLGGLVVGVVSEYEGGNGGQSRGPCGTYRKAPPSLGLAVLGCHERTGLNDL